VRVQDI